MRKLGLAAVIAAVSMLASPASAGVMFDFARVSTDPLVAAGVGDEPVLWFDQQEDSRITFGDVSTSANGSVDAVIDDIVVASAAITSSSAIIFADAASGAMSASGSGTADVYEADAYATSAFGYSLSYWFTVDVASTLVFDYANAHSFYLLDTSLGFIAGGQLGAIGSRSYDLVDGHSYMLNFNHGGSNVVRQDGIGSASGSRSTQVDFAITAGMPEPATWGLMIAGFGLAGVALRRRGAPLATGAATS